MRPRRGWWVANVTHEAGNIARNKTHVYVCHLLRCSQDDSWTPQSFSPDNPGSCSYKCPSWRSFQSTVGNWETEAANSQDRCSQNCRWSVCTAPLCPFPLNWGLFRCFSCVSHSAEVSPCVVFQQALQNAVYKYTVLTFLVCWFLALPPSPIHVQPLTKYYSLETGASPSWGKIKKASSEPKFTHPIPDFCLLRKIYMV